MKSTRLKSVLLAAVCLATTSLMAQDTTGKPKRDTTMKGHRHDSTSMNVPMKMIQGKSNKLQTVFDLNADNITAFAKEMEDKVSAKKPSLRLVS